VLRTSEGQGQNVMPHLNTLTLFTDVQVNRFVERNTLVGYIDVLLRYASCYVWSVPKESTGLQTMEILVLMRWPILRADIGKHDDDDIHNDVTSITTFETIVLDTCELW